MTGTERKQVRRKRGIVLQPRCLTLLREAAFMRVADAKQLAVAAGFHSTTRINTRLLALYHAGLLRRFFIGSTGGRKALYAISEKGAQLIQVPCRGPRRRQDELLIADFFVGHQLAVNEVYCALKFRKTPVSCVHFVQWHSFFAPLAAGLALIPDGYVEWRTPTGIDSAFLEVDLGHEALSIWKEKARHYLQFALSGDFERQFTQPRFRVLVLANSERRMQSIRSAVAGVTQKIFWFAPLDAVQGDKFFGPVWLRPVEREYQPLFKELQ
jgi:hypothetical protein